MVFFKKSFNAVKCKTFLRLATSRIKLLRNMKHRQLQKMKQELANSLQANHEPVAHVKVEHIYREQKIMAAYEILELFCEQIAARFPIIEANKKCPIDMRQAVASIIYAAPRCSDIPELQEIRRQLSAKYGKEFTAIADELRTDCGVNRVIIEKLSVNGPSIEVKLQLMKDIADECGLVWDPMALKSQLLKPREDLLEGPSQFIGASQMSLHSSSDELGYSKAISQHNQRSIFEEDRTTRAQSSVSLDERQPFIWPAVENVGSPPLGNGTSSQVLAQRQGSSGRAPRVSSDTSYERDNDEMHFTQLGQPDIVSELPPVSGHQLPSESFLLQRQSSTDCARLLSSAASYECGEDENARRMLGRMESLRNVAFAACKLAESAGCAAAAVQAAVTIVGQNLDEIGSSTDSESNSDGNEGLQCQANLNGSHREPERNPPPPVDLDSSHLEPRRKLPPFNEAEEQIGQNRKQDSQKYHMRQDGHLAPQSTLSTRHYDDDDDYSGADSVWLSSASVQDRHGNNQARSKELKRGNSSLNPCYQYNTMSPFSLHKSGSGPIFNSYDGKHAEEGAPSTPEEPSKLPGSQATSLAKTRSLTHPKLPESDEFFAHFRALKAKNSKK